MSATGAHHGFQIWTLLHNEFLDENPHVAAGAVGALILILASIVYRIVAPKLTAETGNDRDFVPPANFGIRNIFDLVGEFVQNTAKDIIGSHYHKYLPLLIFIFSWTLLNNLLGMLPGLGSATDNLNTTIAMGICVFIYYNFQGFKSHGFKYLEHYTGHLHGVMLFALGWLMLPIELISNAARPITLGIRLRSNIYGDHTIYGVFTELFGKLGEMLTEHFGVVGKGAGFLISSLGPVPIVLLGILVCVIQAFVFTLLTTIYVGMATAHEEH